MVEASEALDLKINLGAAAAATAAAMRGTVNRGGGGGGGGKCVLALLHSLLRPRTRDFWRRYGCLILT